MQPSDSPALQGSGVAGAVHNVTHELEAARNKSASHEVCLGHADRRRRKTKAATQLKFGEDE